MRLLRFLDERGRRDVIVHYHIWKNAGSSVETALKLVLGHAWSSFEKTTGVWTKDTNITTSDMLGYLEARPELRAISSHTFRWPAPLTFRLKTYPVVFIRHPIDRIGSIYAHRRRLGRADVQGRTFGEYVDWMLRPDGTILMRSFQTLFMSDDDQLSQIWGGGEELSQVTNAHFSSAARRLEDLPTFGLVEHFSESLSLINQWLRNIFPPLPMVSERVNSSPRHGSLDERIRAIREDLGSKRYRWLLSLNDADLELYELATRIFYKRIRSRPAGSVSGAM